MKKLKYVVEEIRLICMLLKWLIVLTLEGDEERKICAWLIKQHITGKAKRIK